MQPLSSISKVLHASRSLLGLSLMHANGLCQKPCRGPPTTRALIHACTPGRHGLQHGVQSNSTFRGEEQRTRALGTNSSPTATAASALTQIIQSQPRPPKVQPHGSAQVPSHPSSSSGSTLRPPSLPSAAPAAPPISPDHVSQLADFISRHRNILVITGAGCSTESNIPDYRGPSGAYTTGFKPMTHQQFMAAPENRAR
jgi:hypothetical protein